MSTLQDLNKVLSRKQAILDENAAGVEQQKKSGKQTARERIAMLLDGGSFVEQSMLAQDAGVVAGSGTVDGRPVYVFAQDFAVMDGAMGAKQAKKIVKILEQARKTGTRLSPCATATARAWARARRRWKHMPTCLRTWPA